MDGGETVHSKRRYFLIAFFNYSVLLGMKKTVIPLRLSAEGRLNLASQ